MSNIDYITKNGLANFWDRDEKRFILAKWIYNHPEYVDRILEFIEQELNTEEEESDDI